MGLNRHRPARRRLPKPERVALLVPKRFDTVGSADFMSATLIDGRRFRTFNGIDDCNREGVPIEVDTSITSMRVVRLFERLSESRALPQVIRTDNGPEFLAEAFTRWAKDHGVAIQYIPPGQPNRNACIERFKRTYDSGARTVRNG